MHFEKREIQLKGKKYKPLFPTPGAPITASFTSERVDFFLRTWGTETFVDCLAPNQFAIAIYLTDPTNAAGGAHPWFDCSLFLFDTFTRSPIGNIHFIHPSPLFFVTFLHGSLWIYCIQSPQSPNLLAVAVPGSYPKSISCHCTQVYPGTQFSAVTVPGSFFLTVTVPGVPVRLSSRQFPTQAVCSSLRKGDLFQISWSSNNTDIRFRVWLYQILRETMDYDATCFPSE